MQQEELKGTVERVIFHSEENGFSVFILRINSSTSTTIRGFVPAVNVGEHVQMNGQWVTHPKFGRQFEAKSCTAKIPTSVIGLKKYLGSGLIKGIGPVYADKLVDYFGENVLDIIDKTPQRLSEIPGIGPKRIGLIANAWKDQKEVAAIMVFLREKNISATYAAKIYKQYGKESIALLNENPYRLSQDIWGIGFKTADTIAQNLGIEPDSIKRIRAALLHTLSQEISNGHLYTELTQLKTKTAILLELDKITIAEKITIGLHDLYNSDKIKLISDQGNHYVALPSHYFSEKGIANKIISLVNHKSKLAINIENVYQQLRIPTNKNDAILNEDQQKGILACLQSKVSIITGGPGTGKTTLVKKLLEVLDANQLKYKLAAPTGRAAKRMMEGTGKHAVTIHRLLEFDVGTYQFKKSEQDALDVDLLIIDEASMIDVFLAHAIVKSIPLNAHLVLIGDIHQLPSVGPGAILQDLITSNTIGYVRLTQIFRQAQNSLIVVNAHRINTGEFPTSHIPGSKRDFIFIKENDPTQVTNHLTMLYNQFLPKHNFSSESSIVLVPMNRGLVGTHTINHTLQQIINPDKNDQNITRHGTTFKQGDRVMQIRNNYDKNVFNGDIGTIHSIDMQEKIVSVQFLNLIISYEFSDLDELVLAYAITIHKSQGSEYPVVIIPMFMQHFTLLQRNLLYTAVTRAKKLCIIIGQPKAIGMAIANNKGTERITFLKEYLTSDLTCR